MLLIAANRTYSPLSIRKSNQMTNQWTHIADRIVQGLAVQAGELIQVRDGAGRYDVLKEILLGIERAGATPLVQIMTEDYLHRLWKDAPQEYLSNWDQHRLSWAQQSQRRIRLVGAEGDGIDTIPDAALAAGMAAWSKAAQRLAGLEDEQISPFMLIAVPTEEGAKKLGVSFESLEDMVLPALGADLLEIKQALDPVLASLQGKQRLIIQSDHGHSLSLQRGDRMWLSDDSYIDVEDLDRGAVVSNLPTGAVYTTVLETYTQGSLCLPRAGPASNVVFHFDKGRIAEIEASRGADVLCAWLDSHSGEPRRVGHIGIGLNPYLHQSVGWALVDHIAQGNLWISLGENRYMGGQNSSSLNVDYIISHATLLADDQVVVSKGKIVI